MAGIDKYLAGTEKYWAEMNKYLPELEKYSPEMKKSEDYQRKILGINREITAPVSLAVLEQTKNGGFRLFGGARVYENSWLSRELAD